MAIRTGTVRRVWFAIHTAMEIFLAIVGEIFVFFDLYNLTLINQQYAIAMGCIFVFKIDLSVLYIPYRRDTCKNFHVFVFTLAEDTRFMTRVEREILLTTRNNRQCCPPNIVAYRFNSF